MQSFYAERFDRDMGCTLVEWLRWLPQALGEHPRELTDQLARVQLGEGQLTIRWQVAPPRIIALARIPRLLVSFDFHQVTDGQRYVYMKRFDLYMQRGGG